MRQCGCTKSPPQGHRTTSTPYVAPTWFPPPPVRVGLPNEPQHRMEATLRSVDIGLESTHMSSCEPPKASQHQPRASESNINDMITNVFDTSTYRGVHAHRKALPHKIVAHIASTRLNWTHREMADSVLSSVRKPPPLVQPRIPLATQQMLGLSRGTATEPTLAGNAPPGPYPFRLANGFEPPQVRRPLTRARGCWRRRCCCFLVLWCSIHPPPQKRHYISLEHPKCRKSHRTTRERFLG